MTERLPSAPPSAAAARFRAARPCSYACGATVSGSRHVCKVCQKRASDFGQALVYAVGRPSFALAAFDVLGGGARSPKWAAKTPAMRELLIRLSNYVRANGDDTAEAVASAHSRGAALGDAEVSAMAARLQTCLRRAVKFPAFERGLQASVTAKRAVPQSASRFLFGAASRGVLGGGK